MDTVSGVSSSPSTSSTFNSLNNKDKEKSTESGGIGLGSGDIVKLSPEREKVLPEVIRYLKRMEIK